MSTFLRTLVVGLLCIPRVAAAQAAPSERELLLAFKESFAASDPSERAAAVTKLGDASRGLPDKGAGKRVAQALVLGLEDDEFEVGAAALFQLGHGRDPDTVLGALDAFLREQHEALTRRIESTDDGARNFVDRATVMFGNGCMVLANYADDRALKTLVGLLAELEPDTKTNDLGSRLIGALAKGALELGTEATAEAAVKQTKTFSGPAQAAGGKKLHDALTAFATRHATTPPEWSEAYSADWFAWFEANRAKLPKKLGKLAKPPESGPRDGMAGLPGKNG